MSTPIRAVLWNSVALLEQIGEQDRLVAFRTMTAESDRSAKKPTGLTAALADEALLAVRTFVDCVGC